MATKKNGERWRYIAFRIESDASIARNDFLTAFLQASKGSPVYEAFRITVFERGFGILKVRHIMKDEAIATLSSLVSVKGSPCKVIPMKTSGTIKTLKEKYKSYVSSKSRESAE